ncbi:MAG: hypothetical protein WCV80_02760 [Candidatus Paceibacterota bacterium]|jgi:uncharacterized repeat protein (TIGR01451 family)
MSLRSLERKLGNPNRKKINSPQTPPSHEETSLRKEVEHHTPEPLHEEGEDARHTRIRKILFIAIGFFAAVLLGAGIFLYSVLSGGGSTRVDFAIVIPNEIIRGVPFEVAVTASNGQESILTNAVVRINLPSNIINVGGINGQNQLVTEEIGDIGAGSLARRTFKFIAIGPVGSTEKLKASINYTAGRNTGFELDEAKDVKVSGVPFKLEVKTPEHVLRGAPFEIEIKYTNITKFDFPDVVLQAKYPTMFKFSSSVPVPPESLDNLWRLGAVRAGSSGTLYVKGTYDGADTSDISVPIVVLATFSGHDYPVVESASALSFGPAPVDLQILVNNQSAYVARVGDTLTYSIHYENKSGIALADVVVRATIAGEMLNVSAIDTNALLDPMTNEFIWNASNVPAFRLLDAGASGDVLVTTHLKNLFPLKRLGDKNYSLRAHATLNSPSVPPYLQASKTFVEAGLETKVAGLVAIDAQLFYRDTTVSVFNAGPFPPKVGHATEYSVHWILRNFSTDISNVEVRATLSSGVLFVGAIESSGEKTPVYDAERNQVVWTIERVPAGKGVSNDLFEAVFQVRATPTSAQVGQFQPILGESILTATDEFTELELTGRDVGVSTTLPDDKTVGQEGGRVAP